MLTTTYTANQPVTDESNEPRLLDGVEQAVSVVLGLCPLRLRLQPNVAPRGLSHAFATSAGCLY
eukprot:COSAG02_NODE_43150_length_377_cov_1.255396_1_plen_63_part_10